MESKFRLTCDKDDVRIDVYLSERLSLPRSQIKSHDRGGPRPRSTERPPKPSFKVRRDIEIEGEMVREEPSPSWPKTSRSRFSMKTTIFS